MYILLFVKRLEQGEHIMNGQNLLSPKGNKDNNLVFEDKNLVKISRSKLG